MIELKPHVGKHMVTGRPIELKQDMIFCDGEHVGYIGHQPGAPLNLITRTLQDFQIAEISEAIARKFGGWAGPVSMPPEIDEDTWADFEDDEEDGE